MAFPPSPVNGDKYTTARGVNLVYLDGGWYSEQADGSRPVVFANTVADFPAIGEDGLLYVDRAANGLYRWGGSGYVAFAGGGGGSITIDPVPTDGSPNAVSSNGTFDALATKATPNDIVLALQAHTMAVNPHPQYLEQVEGDALYAPISHTHVAANITDFTEAAQDAVGAAVAAGVGDGVTLTYVDSGNRIDALNTDKGSVAVTALKAETDPFPQYTTVGEAAAAAPVQSVFGRTGAVTAQQSDYDAFFTTVAEAAAAAPVQSFNGRVGAISPLQSDYDAFFTTPAEAAALAPVQSFNGRTGAIAPIQADYDSFFTTPAEALTIADSSVATHVALANPHTQYILVTEKGAANGVAPLGADSKVPAAFLPAYVDDVLEFATLAAFPIAGETGKIYVALDTNKTYRWGGSSYTEISPSPGSTDAVPEGATNLYFTDERAQDAVGGILATSPSIQFVYDDAGNSISANVRASGVVAGSAGTASRSASLTVAADGRVTALSDQPIAITSAQVTDFTEAAQDAVGGALVDTQSINLTYDDAGNAIFANAITQMSVTQDAAGIRLDGDAAAPGNNKAYGTNAAGVKGYHDKTVIMDGAAQVAVPRIWIGTATVAGGAGNFTAAIPAGFFSTPPKVTVTAISQSNAVPTVDYATLTAAPTATTVTGKCTRGVALALGGNTQANSPNGVVVHIIAMGNG